MFDNTTGQQLRLLGAYERIMGGHAVRIVVRREGNA
jgi:hypothetical protein